MATFRQLRSGKTQVIIRKKNYPKITRSFLTRTTAKRWARLIETQMDNRVFQDLSGAEGTTLKDLLIKCHKANYPYKTLVRMVKHIKSFLNVFCHDLK